MSPILGIYASQISGHLYAPPSAYSSIQTVTVGAGGQSTITFSSIPSTYTHLQIRALVKNSKTSVASDLQLETQFNSDTGANYDFHYLYGNGATAGSVASGASQTSLASGSSENTASTQTNGFAVNVIDILDYANTNKYKTVRALSGWDSNGAGVAYLNSGLWMSTSAINTIKFAVTGFTFSQYSSFALYGVN